ncbi:MAG: acetate--CoA ligase family protein [Candidatus Aminicenantales bacterium]
MSKLDSLFYPRSIAVIGASRRPGSVGHSLLANLLMNRYQGIIYPVNPNASSVLSIKCYPRVLEISDDVDLAVVIVPSRFVASVIEDCGRMGIKAAIVISAGFKEIGGKGVDLEQRVLEVSRKYDIALVGPNCLGIINTDPVSQMSATFATDMPKVGNIGFISQSGALCVAVLNYAQEANIGFSKFISMGNKAGVGENELLSYLKSDPKTDVILMYLEDLVNGREFMRIARETTGSIKRPKPIIALKAGRTLPGARAASSHTGSLAGSDRVYDAIFEQSGVLRVETLEELFDYVKGFSRQPLPEGPNVGIVTNSGGPGILATDACIRHGLNIPPLSGPTVSKLRRVLPKTASLHNPVDLVAEAQAEQYEAALRSVLRDRQIHSAIVILTSTAFTEVDKISAAVVKVAGEFEKPVVSCLLGVFDVSKGIEILEADGIPNYRFPESAARVLSEMAKFTLWRGRPQTRARAYRVDKVKVKAIFDAVKKEGRRFLLEQEAYDVLRAYRFPVIESRLAGTEGEAAEAARKIGFPVVLKIASADVVHKFDFDAVRLDLKDEAEVRQAYREILKNVRRRKRNARIAGVTVEKMARPGKEIILGMSRDLQFGPVLMFGLGGIYVEALEDVSFRLAPIREYSALAMIRKTKTHKILEGFRGGPVYDLEAIAECLKKLSQLVVDFEDIQELDINPLFVYEKGQGCRVVDARIVIKDDVHRP